MGLIAQGRSVTSISETLVISVSTVQTHSKNLYRKLEIHSRQELLDLIEDAKPRVSCELQVPLREETEKR